MLKYVYILYILLLTSCSTPSLLKYNQVDNNKIVDKISQSDAAELLQQNNKQAHDLATIGAIYNYHHKLPYIAYACILSGLALALLRCYNQATICGIVGILLLLLPALYPAIINYAPACLLLLLLLPIIWYIDHRRLKRIAKASKASYEHIKTIHPDVAAKSRDIFRTSIKNSDTTYINKL